MRPKKKAAYRYVRGKPDTRAAEPKNAKDTLFCERWMVHRDVIKAWKEAGFGHSGAAGTRAKTKLAKFQKWIEARLPKLEAVVAQKMGHERADILNAIANIAHANILNYLVPVTVIKDGVSVTELRMKHVGELTRDEAAGLDVVFNDVATGQVGYRLPSAKTRLDALRTLGAQTAGFASKEKAKHQHIHLHGEMPLEKLRELKGQLIQLVGGPDKVRNIFGMPQNEDVVENDTK